MRARLNVPRVARPLSPGNLAKPFLYLRPHYMETSLSLQPSTISYPAITIQVREYL